jgi:glycosyltransferase involved in cell wall biosynthesis
MNRIGINLIHVDPNYAGGVTAYARGLSEGFSQHGRVSKLVFFLSSKNSEFFSFLNANPDLEIRILEHDSSINRKSFFALKSKLLRYFPSFFMNFVSYVSMRKQVRILEHVDLMYTPYGPPPIFPYISKPQVFSIHDIQHQYFPEFFSQDQLVERNYTFARVAKLAAGVQASSSQMKENFISSFRTLNMDNVRIIPEGVDISYFGTLAEPPSTLAIQSVLRENYYYMPAQLWPHKNHKTVIEAFRLVRDEQVKAKLVLTGAPYGAQDQILRQIEEAGLEETVLYLGVVERNDVRALYQSSQGVISAALYESNSLPILEAAASSVQIFAGDTPPNVELAKSISINLFENENPSALSKLIVSKEKGGINSAVASNNMKLIEFEWGSIANAYLDWFDEIILLKAKQ